MKIQEILNRNGVYDEFYKHYANKDFYVKPLMDYLTGHGIDSQNFEQPVVQQAV